MEEQELLNEIQGLLYKINTLLGTAYDMNLDVKINQRLIYTYVGTLPKSYLDMEAFKRLTPNVVVPTGM